MNIVALTGRLVRDPELRYTPNGTPVANFTIAVNRPTRDGQQDADFLNCVAWNKTAETLAQYQRKGNMIGVEGSLQSRSYDGNDGKKVYVTEVVARKITFLEPINKNNGNGGQMPQAQGGYQQMPVNQAYSQQMQPQAQKMPQTQQMPVQSQQMPQQPQQQVAPQQTMQEIDISDEDLPF